MVMYCENYERCYMCSLKVHWMDILHLILYVIVTIDVMYGFFLHRLPLYTKSDQFITFVVNTGF